MCLYLNRVVVVGRLEGDEHQGENIHLIFVEEKQLYHPLDFLPFN